MNTARKSFIISLTFHALMGSLAFWILTQINTPPKLLKIPIRSVTLVSLCEPAPSVMQATPAETIAPPLHKKPLPVKQPVSAQPKSAFVPPAPKAAPIAPPFIPHEVPAPSASIAPPVQAHVAPVPSPAKAPPKPDLTAEKKSFFAALRATIQNHLRYPSSARRRGMEGDVNVRFVLENTGVIRDVNIRRGEPIFHDAAKLAVTSASGVKIPDALSDTLPTEIELMLEFRLNRID